ncbi:Integral membrane protein [Colletotrichum higginsianum IMI 349063]|uniref:Integral membrane protein n=1 Tax=Colletotrichum higginsianum (strain IMI 349063) TaxID=759273 RepID=A0A1B7Y3M6_COLHI|nr:Integral membrane protein [Colletotrichum higginsianum IMI 349063]OBR06593.1 Integral membrane protein [Colletotrichum higginsianum IMI 349063]
MSDAAAPPTTSTDNRNALVIGVSSAFMAITVLFMALRVYIRGYILRAWGLDDSMFIWASILAIAQCAVVQCISFAFAKATFLLQYRRAFALPSIKIFCDGFSGVFFVIVSAMLIYSGIILDRSTSNGHSPNGKKPDLLVFGYVNAAMHLVTNIIIFILPIALVQKMRLAPTQKVGLIASFGVGIFTSAISILRIVSLPIGLDNNDPTYNNVPLGLLSLAEPTSAIICACAPLVRPLLSWPRTLRYGSQSPQRPCSEVVGGSDNTGRMHLRHNGPPQSPASPTSPTTPRMAGVVDVEGSVNGDIEGYHASQQARGSIHDMDPLTMHPSTPTEKRPES